VHEFTPRLGVAGILPEKALKRFLKIAQRLLQALARRIGKEGNSFFSAGRSSAPVQ